MLVGKAHALLISSEFSHVDQLAAEDARTLHRIRVPH
jgi:hypothetical protein